jgi:hypothetical protein
MAKMEVAIQVSLLRGYWFLLFLLLFFSPSPVLGNPCFMGFYVL